MSIFEFIDYKSFVRAWLKSQPKNGRGLYLDWSKQLKVSSTMISQIFSGDKEMSHELANDFCEVLKLSDTESDYFLLLVDYARAGTASLRRRYKRKIEAEQLRSQNLSSRLEVENVLSEYAQSVFYSNWLYSAVRNLTAIDQLNNVDAISAHLKMPRKNIQNILEFLLENGLCTQEKGMIKPGVKRTHVGAKSPLVIKHHQNWRLQGFNRMPFYDDDELFFTFPMSLSHEDIKKIRFQLTSFIEEVHKTVAPSDSQSTRCLNIDFFKF